MLTPDQVAPLTLRPLMRSEYDRLIDVGIFHEDERVQLIKGALVRMSPQKPPHTFATSEISKALNRALGDRAEVRVQFPLALTDDSEPEPDIAVVPPGEYRTEHPTTAWLIVEVAGDSLSFDRKVKGPLYAEAGVSEYWIVNLSDRVVEVHTEPGPTGYAKQRVVASGERLVFERFPDVTIAVRDILP